MLIVVSPAKTLDYESEPTTKIHSQPALLERAVPLVDTLSTKSPRSLAKLMNLSPALAELNVERYHQWSTPFKPSNAKQAVLAFKGDVYLGLEAERFTDRQMEYAQAHLRILSGLYGVLRPLDLMQPYRLEMGTKLKVKKHANLYQYWGSDITNEINKQLQTIDSNIVLNLASNEYFKSIKVRELAADVVTPKFLDWSNGQYKMIGYFAKKARGQMAAWVIKQRAKTVNKLLKYNIEGYQYSEQDSDPLKPVFVRKQTS
ncbi:MAG: peroxide stress protein YaaA [Gammaproteobacteria bacterium]|nr:peroxide stress protein YaaA [Gammaproteobacteria bacterium]